MFLTAKLPPAGSRYGYSDPTTGVVPNDKVMRGLKADLARPPPHWDTDVPLEEIIPQIVGGSGRIRAA